MKDFLWLGLLTNKFLGQQTLGLLTNKKKEKDEEIS